MLPFQKILFPVDYSAPCQALIPYVQEMASHFSAELTVCHAYEPLTAIAHSELLVTDPNLQAKAQALEEDRLRQFACRAFPGQKLETMAALGEPGTVIDRLVQEQRADLVMLATHGHGPLRRLLLGSITAKVLHDVSAAVWTGMGAELSEHPIRIPYQSIVCALDDSAEAECVLRAAWSLASAYRAQLWIVHVVPTPPAYPDIDIDAHTRQLTEASQARLRELKAKLGVDAPHTVIDALLAEGIHREVVRRKADLLVTGRGHSIGTLSRLWSHLYSIIRDSPCPVLSV
ncbi:MAG TPA: universal stress protein [Bryobacteraceae bacterium]|nr:universal stress protein [Bryobacteraceae bacterium]